MTRQILERFPSFEKNKEEICQCHLRIKNMIRFIVVLIYNSKTLYFFTITINLLSLQWWTWCFKKNSISKPEDRKNTWTVIVNSYQNNICVTMHNTQDSVLFLSGKLLNQLQWYWIAQTQAECSIWAYHAMPPSILKRQHFSWLTQRKEPTLPWIGQPY